MITSVRCLILMGTLFIGWNTVVEGQEITQGDKQLPMAGESFQFNGHDAFFIIPEKKITQKKYILSSIISNGIKLFYFNKVIV